MPLGAASRKQKNRTREAYSQGPVHAASGSDQKSTGDMSSSIMNAIDHRAMTEGSTKLQEELRIGHLERADRLFGGLDITGTGRIDQIA